MATIRLTWGAVLGAIQYNIYHSLESGLSVAHSDLLTTTDALTYDHTGLTFGSIHYYIVVAVGPNNELSPPSSEIVVNLNVVTLTSIVVTPSNLSLALTQQQQYTATGHYNDGSTADLTNLVTWSTSDDAYAIATNIDLIPVPNAVVNGTFETGTLTGWNITTGTLALPQYTAGDPLSLGGDTSDPNPYLNHIDVVANGYTFSPYSSTATAFNGTYSLLVGSSATSSEDQGYNEVTQTFVVPSVGQPQLSFQAKFYDPEGDTTNYDFQQAILVDATTNDTLIDLFNTIDNYPTEPFVAQDDNASWINFTTDLSLYAGKTVKLVFRNRGDGSSDPTWLLIDDIKTIANDTTKGVITANSFRSGAVDVIATLNAVSGSTTLTITPDLLSLNLSILYTSSFGRQYQAIGTYSDSSTRILNEFVVWDSTNAGIANVNATGFVILTYTSGTAIVSATLDSLSASVTINMIDAWTSEALYTNPPTAPTFSSGSATSSPTTAIFAAYNNTANNIVAADGGGSWSNNSLSLGSPPSNTNCVWASGATVIIGATGTTSNAIIRSINSGSSWATVSNSTTSDIRSVHGSSTSDIWAGGELNKLIHSIDNGASWSSVSFPGGYINAIYARTSTDIWFGGVNSGGTNGVLYQYNGSTFTDYFANLSNTMYVTSIWASSSTDVYVAGISIDGQIQYIHHSTDGGSSFTFERKMFIASYTTKPSVLGIDASNVYFGGSPTQLLKTDGGGTWAREDVSIATIHTSDRTAGLDALMGLDNTNLWTAGAGFIGGSINHSFILKRNNGQIIQPTLLSIIVSAGPTTFINNGSAIDASTTTIFVATNTTGLFPSSGTIKIDDEEITYTSKSSFGFFGCTRGANSTTATSHADQSLIVNLEYRVLSTTGQYNALGIYDDGRIVELTPDVMWASSNNSIATITNSMDNIGIATRVATGSTIISATLGSVVGTLQITTT